MAVAACAQVFAVQELLRLIGEQVSATDTTQRYLPIFTNADSGPEDYLQPMSREQGLQFYFHSASLC